MQDEIEDRLEKILKIHPFLKRRPVKIISTDATKRKGWYGSGHRDQLELTGVVVNIHSSVIEAVNVKTESGKTMYWHFEDLELIEIEEKKIEPVFFNPASLVI